MAIEQVAAERHKIAAGMTVLDLGRRGIQIRRDEGAAQQRFQERLHIRLGMNHAHGVNDLAGLQTVLRGLALFARSHFAGKRELFFILILLDGQGRNTRASGLVRAQFRKNFLRGGGLFRQHDLEIVAQCIFHRGHKLIRHADAISQRANDRARLAQGRHGTRVETFVRTFELFEHMQTGTFFGLLLQKFILRLRRGVQFALQLAEAILPLLHGAARGGDVQFFQLHTDGKFLQAGFEPDALFFELNFFRGKFFEANQVPLLGKVQRRELIAHAGQILRGGERRGLRLAQGFLLQAQAFLDFAEGILPGLQGFPVLRQRGFGGRQLFRDDGDLFLRGAMALLGLGNLLERLQVLRLDLMDALLIEMDAALVALGFALQFQPALLLRGDFVLQFHEPFAQLGDFIFKAEDVVRTGFNFVAKIFHRGLAPGNLALQHVKLMPRELGFEMLQFVLNLFVAAGLARLTLERTDLALHFLDGIGDAQEILLGVFQLAERFFFLRLEFCDARRLLENHPAIFRLAGKNLGDVTLRQNTVARATNAGAHEQLLDVLKAARRAVEKIFAATVTKNPAGERHFIVGDLDARRLQTFFTNPAEGERNFAHAHRFAAIGAVEDHIGHFATAQGLGGLLAEHPADGVGDVGFAAAVGTDDGGDTGLEVQSGLIRERFKAKNG